MSTSAVAEIFNKHLQTLHTWMRAGKVPRPRQDPHNKEYEWTAEDIFRLGNSVQPTKEFSFDVSPVDFRRRVGSRNIVASVQNQKGGVGKTTTVANIAAVAQQWGYKVLILDIDTQRDITSFISSKIKSSSSQEEYAEDLSRQVEDLAKSNGTILDLYKGSSIHKLIRRSRFPLIDFIPGSRDLSELNRSFVEDFHSVISILKTELEKVQDTYEIVLIDCPANVTESTALWNVLLASTGVIIPLIPSALSWLSVDRLLEKIREVRTSRMNSDLEIYGYLINQYRTSTNWSQWFWEEFQRYHNSKAFTSVVKYTVAFEEGIYAGLPIVVTQPNSEPANAFREIFRDLIAIHCHRFRMRAGSTAAVF